MAQEADVDEVAAAWNDICSDEPTKNWYLCELAGGKNSELNVVNSGDNGLQELSDILVEASDHIYFALLRVEARDQSNSVRAKFVYVRYVGSTVGVMKKAKLTPQLAKIADNFPVKHLTIDLTEDLTNFDIESLAKEFLRVGGAHKPDKYVFGPDQEYACNN